MNDANILLVEDNLEVLNMNLEALEANGYKVSAAQTVRQAKEALAENVPDLIMLDIMLPDGSGIDLCRKIRGATAAPILFLTSLNENEQVVQGLRAGGDDYITKPYSIEELCARVEAQLRRIRLMRQAFHKTEIGSLRLDMKSGRAYLNGADLLLKPKEFLMFALLIRAEGKYLTTEELYTEVWGMKLNENSLTVRVHISNLRRILKAAGANVQIEHEANLGYRLTVAGSDERRIL